MIVREQGSGIRRALTAEPEPLCNDELRLNFENRSSGMSEKEEILAFCGSAISFRNVAGNADGGRRSWFARPKRSESGKEAVSW